MPDRQKGVVARWLNHKGIGFITPEGCEAGEKDVLVHYEQVKQETEDGFRSLQAGSTVEFSLQPDPRDPEKVLAMSVTGPDGADCEARVKGKKKGEGKKEGSADEGGEKKSKGKGKGGKKGRKGKGKGARKGKGEKKKEGESTEESKEE